MQFNRHKFIRLKAPISYLLAALVMLTPLPQVSAVEIDGLKLPRFPWEEQRSLDYCYETRAVMDIKPYVSQVIVAVVDACLGVIDKVLENRQVEVGYGDNIIAKSQDVEVIEKHILEVGLKIIRQFRKIADVHRPKARVALVSSALKKASNSPIFINLLEKVGKMRVIDNDILETAQIGMSAVSSIFKRHNPDVIVWDIRATSSSMITPKENLKIKTSETQNYYYYFDNMASVTFKNWILNSLYKNPKTGNIPKSPNPMRKEFSKKALVFATEYASQTVPKKIKELAKSRPVIGIGGVHIYNFPDQNGFFYKLNKAELQSEIYRLKEYSDRSLGHSQFAPMRVSNLIMVLGYMEALELEHIHVMKANNLLGLFLLNSQWY